jgi:hypothetical protein
LALAGGGSGRERGRKMNRMQIMYTKMISVETVPGMGERANSSVIYLIYCKNLCKCYNVPPPSTTMKKGINK